MSRKKAFIFILLMLPNIVSASLSSPIFNLFVSLMSSGSGGVIGYWVGSLGGAVYVRLSEEKDNAGKFKSSYEEIQTRMSVTCDKAAMIGVLTGSVVGWYAGRPLIHFISAKK